MKQVSDWSQKTCIDVPQAPGVCHLPGVCMAVGKLAGHIQVSPIVGEQISVPGHRHDNGDREPDRERHDKNQDGWMRAN